MHRSGKVHPAIVAASIRVREMLALFAHSDVDLGICSTEQNWVVRTGTVGEVVRVKQKIWISKENPALQLDTLEASVYTATIGDLLLAVRHAESEAANQSVIEVVDSLNPYTWNIQRSLLHAPRRPCVAGGLKANDPVWLYFRLFYC